jgi:hypothetical protein
MLRQEQQYRAEAPRIGFSAKRRLRIVDKRLNTMTGMRSFDSLVAPRAPRDV